MKIKILDARSRELAVLEFSTAPTLDQLKKQFQEKKRVDTTRQAFYTVENGKRGKVIPPGKEPIADLKDGSELVFKDLGPQVAWRTVFLTEYFGPIFAFPLAYYLSPYIHGEQVQLNQTQIIATVLFIVHFVKRELETIFVHVFGNDTMPLFNLFKNSIYYWGYAFLVAYFTIHPKYQSPAEWQVYVGAAGTVLSMLGNFYCHIILKNLRQPGSRERKIPRGFLFEYVTCPNYTFEIMEWFFFSFMIQSIPCLLYTLSGAGQMLPWAIKKHVGLKKLFDGKDGRELYPKNRKVLIPFIL
ncbi:hypothetical protein FDP41_010664 [Naegleria fowleri]|uniref:3-oxo-5-alpha-steroid 4-dehydrogenase C-terminal domain-containing protein n=1 Tax=Naegleria fowleri TaxID=5763 RepID=A0A6A5CE70_NAEFO|nr:uncharacterized protein FDP41_010664 [Naegleria fowleri]KAF0983599.1 hypothetical protein FDP41_010664 [Naegleria fowleri]CAG4719367.1 unnamed protein product [Naegleria fowleri]